MMRQIAYFSTAAGEQDASTVHRILVEARRANHRDSITGLLVAGEGRYLQAIEGPEAVVEALYGRILKDKRHHTVAAFSDRKITERSFGGWSMAYRRQTAVGELNSFDDILNALTTDIADTDLKHQIRYFARAMISARAALRNVGKS